MVMAFRLDKENCVILLDSQDVVYLATVEKIYTNIEEPIWRELVPLEATGIYARSELYGMVRIIGHKSVAKALKALSPNWQFYKLIPGLHVNLWYCRGMHIDVLGTRIADLVVNGVEEGLAMSRRYGARFLRALEKFRRRRWPPSRPPGATRPGVERAIKVARPKKAARKP